MATHCAWCGSVNTAPGLDEYQCFTCGKQTSMDGKPVILMTQTTIPAEEPVLQYDEPGSRDRRRRPGYTTMEEPMSDETPEYTEAPTILAQDPEGVKNVPSELAEDKPVAEPTSVAPVVSQPVAPVEEASPEAPVAPVEEASPEAPEAPVAPVEEASPEAPVAPVGEASPEAPVA